MTQLADLCCNLLCHPSSLYLRFSDISSEWYALHHVDAHTTYIRFIKSTEKSILFHYIPQVWAHNTEICLTSIVINTFTKHFSCSFFWFLSSFVTVVSSAECLKLSVLMYTCCFGSIIVLSSPNLEGLPLHMIYSLTSFSGYLRESLYDGLSCKSDLQSIYCRYQ